MDRVNYLRTRATNGPVLDERFGPAACILSRQLALLLRPGSVIMEA
jgi:hypothetical protein